MLRIATLNAYSTVISNLQTRQQALTDANEQLTSGKRVQKASDDPTAAAQAERARSMQMRADAQQHAIDASQTAMTLTESTLGNAGELLQQARELLVQAGDGSYSDGQRSAIAQQLSAVRKQLLAVANTGNGNGGYVFSGQGSSQTPFLDSPGGVAYVGVGGQAQVGADGQLPITLDGNAIWMSAHSGNGVFKTGPGASPLQAPTNAWIDSGTVTDPSKITGDNYTVTFAVNAGVTTYSIDRTDAAGNVSTAVSGAPYKSGSAVQIDGMAFNITGAPVNGDSFQIAPSQPNQTVFNALDQAIKDLNTPLRSNAQVAQTVAIGLRDIDASAAQIQSAQSLAGETLNSLDNATARVADQKLAGKTTESNATDLDMVSAIASFKDQQTGYQAALQTYASVQKMSLFQYINA
jgi:flagellar hook-associated protein 3 FlgL